MLIELGSVKNASGSMFKNEDKICKCLLGDTYEDEDYDLDSELDKYIIPHLYVPGTTTEAHSYIMFETNYSRARTSTKNIDLIVQVFCHKDIVDYPEKPIGYPGLRYDVLAEYVEELLCPKDEKKKGKLLKKFDIIGAFEMKEPDLFLMKDFVGRVLTFTAPAFR